MLDQTWLYSLSLLLKRVSLKTKKEASLTYSIINIIIKSWCRILKARCILLRNYPTEVILWEFNYQALELRLGLRWRLLVLIFVNPFMLWRHQFEMSEHVKTSQEFKVSHPHSTAPLNPSVQMWGCQMLEQWSDCRQESSQFVPHQGLLCHCCCTIDLIPVEDNLLGRSHKK